MKSAFACGSNASRPTTASDPRARASLKPDYYLYKCVVDDGKAPCVDGGRLSLTICKPQIRRSAEIGDFLIAFGSNREHPPNRLVYVARITEVVKQGDYFADLRFRRRQDCIYHRTPGGGLRLRRDATVHLTPPAQHRDLGLAPDYPNAIALVSDDFRYFGKAGTDVWKAHAPELTKVVEQLGQGHRVNHSRWIRDELRRLQQLLWQRYLRRVNGRPLHAESCGRHNSSGVKRPRRAQGVRGRRREDC